MMAAMTKIILVMEGEAIRKNHKTEMWGKKYVVRESGFDTAAFYFSIGGKYIVGNTQGAMRVARSNFSMKDDSPRTIK
ncbi:hypothetical protein E2C01_035440 [Portunus trituberculatus]|uniref:Uncharacterized protein n=1 Tax=Portunus trituberculatus TaxID=210409 RepID=A0A5B7F9S0_PORTR|nr:hypothetical protein [Portunus trituberculatus]